MAYGVWQYYMCTGEQDFVDKYGYELMLDCAKFWSSRLEPGEDGQSRIEAEYARYLEAEAVLARCSTPRERLLEEKASVYEQLAQVNREIRVARKKLAMCQEIQNRLPQMEQTISKIESKDEVTHDERRRR